MSVTVYIFPKYRMQQRKINVVSSVATAKQRRVGTTNYRWTNRLLLAVDRRGESWGTHIRQFLHITPGLRSRNISVFLYEEVT
jgi:hypothetical protein